MDPLVYAEAGYKPSRHNNANRTPRYVKLALVLLALVGVVLGAVFTMGADTPTNAGAHPRALLDVEADGLEARFDDLLNARLAELAEQSCVKIPDPEIRRTEIQFDPPQPKNARSLPAVTVIEGDELLFVNTDQNNYENPSQQAPWLSDVWKTNMEDYDACAINTNGKPTDATFRLFFSNEVRDGKALFQVPPAEEGTTLYFSTANGWKRQQKWGWCTRGLKLTVNVLPRPTVVKCDGSIGNLFLSADDNLQTGAAVAAAATAAAATDEKVAEIEMEAAQQAALVNDLDAVVTKLSEKVKRRSSTIEVLSQQLMLAQQQTEHRVRAEGSSGIVDVRGFKGGIDAFSDSSFVGRGVGAIHNHGNFMDTMGMGEVEVVLNGVMFKTRHNDYRLQTPSYTSGEYGAVQPIAFPDVPQRVLDQPTVAEEIEEMKKWFRAWKAQDSSAAANDDGVARDYTQHFRPVLCYLEGAWVTDDNAMLSQRDPDSDRHALEASNMFDLHNKTAYMANSGRKNTRENLAFMPSAVRRMVLDEHQDTIPEVANFESRIACQLLEGDVPTGRFRVAQDLHSQLKGRPLTREELGMTRRARYELHTNPSETPAGEPFTGWDDHADVHQRREYEYLDALMEQVAGKDNNASPKLFDDLEGNRAMHRVRDEELDVSRYSRFYQLRQKDAMGFQSRRRGFADRYMWAARTTQEKVSPVAAAFGKTKHNDKEKVTSEQRWTYAIPIEVVYLTPLTRWNPYNLVNHTPEHLERHGGDKAARIAAEAPVTAGGVDLDGNERPRNGKCDMGDGMALNGVKRSLFYRTPVEFFEAGQAMTPDPADTSGSGKGMCVLDPNGVVRRVAASGHHVFIPSIGGGVGSLRQRYPIMPLHVDGATGYKETKALAALTLGLPENDEHHVHGAGHGAHYEHARNGVFGESRDEAFGFNLVLSGGDHDHTVTLTATKLKLLEEREAAYLAAGSTGRIPKVVVPTEERNAHQHIVGVSRRPSEDGGYIYTLEGCKIGGLRQGGTADAGAANDWGFECSDGHNALARSVALPATLKRLA